MMVKLIRHSNPIAANLIGKKGVVMNDFGDYKIVSFGSKSLVCKNSEIAIVNNEGNRS